MNRLFHIFILGLLIPLQFSAEATDLIGGEAPKMLTPEEALKTFTMAEGYQINLWASEVETEIESPAGMTFDSQGRLWVSCVASQPHALPDKKPKDSIVVLEDTDRDGVADKSTVFYDDLYLPMGLTVADGGKTVYVASEPNLLKLTDHDGDLKADEVQIMMHGFGTEDNHHYISAFQWAPDGRLHFGQGLFLNSQVETPHGVVRAYEGTIFRLDPRDQKLEIHSSFGFSNPWGIIFGKWGEPLLADASPAMNYYLTHMASRFDYPKEDKYANYIKKRGGFSFTPTGRRPSCGNEILAHEHWPEEVRGWYTTNQMKGWHGVRWYKLSQTGSGYTSEQPLADPQSDEEGSGELMSCSDITFRPVAQQIGPDGALYVLDYYNPIVGHTTYSFRDPRRIQTHGRVWRITAKDRPTPWQPEIRNADNEALLELLLSPNERWGYHARRELQQREAKTVLAATDAWQAKHRDNDHALTEVLWMYQNFNSPQPKRLGRLLESEDHNARTAALRILRHWQQSLPEEVTLPMLEKAIVDSNQRVRLEAMIACGFHPNSGAAIQIAAKALDLEIDHGFQLAARETLGWLSKNVAAVPPKVDSFLLPGLPDDELLTRSPTVETATEILARPGISADEKQSALRIIGKPENRESLDQLLHLLSGEAGREITEGKIESLLLSWDSAALAGRTEELEKLAETTGNASVRSAALAVLLRQQAKPDSSIPAALWIAAMPQAGRGKIAEEWHPVVTEYLEKTGPAKANAIKALPLFADHDKASAEMFAKIATENRDSNIALAFSALDALKRIPEASRPQDSSNLTLTRIRIAATANLRFDPAEFSVPPGSAVELVFYNPDNLYHNLAIVDPEALDRVGLKADMMAGSPDGLKNDYIPDDPGVLHATPQLTIGGARSHTLRFFAPEKPGEYPYICTYPGHWRAMRGTMHVKAVD